MGFSRQEYWSGLPFPPPEDLPDPGIQLASPVSPALQAVLYPLSHREATICKMGVGLKDAIHANPFVLTTMDSAK